MPRGDALAPPAEQHNTLYHILNDFKEGKARVYRGIPAIRVFAESVKHLPTGDYPYYEHTMYGHKFVSFITYTGIEEFLKKELGRRVAGPVNPKTNQPSHFIRKFEWETVYVDLYLTPHEKAAFDIGDAHNTSNLFRSFNRPMMSEDETGEVTTYRSGIYEAIVNVSHEPVAVDYGKTHVDIWPSGPNQGRYLADLDEEFLTYTVQRGSSSTVGEHEQNLAAIAAAEIDRRESLKKADEKSVTTKKGGDK